MSLKTNPVSSGYSTGVINSNFKKIEEYVNDNLLNRDGVTPGEPNQMEVDLDMNSQDILNVGRINAKEIGLDGIPIKELLDNTVEEATQEANRAEQEADRAERVVANVEAALDEKVDKAAGMGLSTNDFTDPLRDKLIGLEGTHWRGTFVSLAALQAGVTDPEAGDYADVDAVGDDVVRYIWDATDGIWVVQSGAVAPITASQVKLLYESNPDTNAFTDADVEKLDGLGSAAFRQDWFFQLATPGSRNKTEKSFCDHLQMLNPVHEQYIWDDTAGSGFVRVGFRFDDSYLVEYRYSPDADGFVRLKQVKIGKGGLHTNGIIILNDSGPVIRYAHDNSVLEFALNVRAAGQAHAHSWVPRHGAGGGATSNQSVRWMVDGLTRFSLPTEPEMCKKVVCIQSYNAHNAAATEVRLWSGLISYSLDQSGLTVDHRFKPDTPLEVYQGYLSMLPARNELYNLVVGSLPQRAGGIPVDGSQPVFESTLWGDSAMFLSGAFQPGRYSGWAIDVGDIYTSMGDYFTPEGSKDIQIYDRDDGVSKLYYPFSKGQILSNSSTVRSVNRYFCAPAMRPPVAAHLI